MNKNNRKEYLYAVAFKLFLTKRYEAVSISDIEKESGMTRGAITYYGKDKLGLFYDVISCFILSISSFAGSTKVSNSSFVTSKRQL